MLANTAVVSNSPQSLSGLPHFPSPESEIVVSASNEHLSLQPGHVETSRVAAIKQRIRTSGFSNKVAKLAAAPQRRSSLRLYQSYFTKFCNWCNQSDVCTSNATVLDLAEFLVYLFEVLKLAPSTIANYKSALAPAVGSCDGFPACSHPCLSNLLKSFKKASVPRRIRVPDWDLSFVLEKLRQPPFEPLSWGDKESRTRVTLKTVFLLALASAKRRGELQALSRDAQDLIFSKSGVHLRTVAGFLPKVAVNDHDPKPFFIPRLTPFSGQDSDDRLLCPVRALKFYVTATGGHKPEARLFCKIQGEGMVSSQTISSWIVRCIRLCYDRDIPAHAHEVRRVAVSWAYKGGVHCINDILCAGTWASHSTFSSFYLADVRLQPNNKFRLHPVVAGKQVSAL